MVGEVGKLLSVPSARIELAHRGDTRGILSLDVSEDADLVHGNELLAGLVAEYPKGELRRIDTYRIDRVVAALERVDPSPVTGRPAAEDFAGCLVLDALVANTDRHHENWAVLVARRGARSATLAPTFDHASSLACGLTDDECMRRLSTIDEGSSVAAFARRACSHFADARTLGDAVRRMAEVAPRAVAHWRARLADVQIHEMIDLIAQVPDMRMSSPSRQFAAALLKANYVRLLELMEDLP